MCLYICKMCILIHCDFIILALGEWHLNCVILWLFLVHVYQCFQISAAQKWYHICTYDKDHWVTGHYRHWSRFTFMRHWVSCAFHMQRLAAIMWQTLPLVILPLWQMCVMEPVLMSGCNKLQSSMSAPRQIFGVAIWMHSTATSDGRSVSAMSMVSFSICDVIIIGKDVTKMVTILYHIEY